MNTTVYLIRHGEVEYRLNEKGERMMYGPEAHLSQFGIEQIRRLGKTLSCEPNKITVLYSSPFTRAQETAKILAEILKVKVLTDERLKDVYTPGQEKMTMAEAIKKIRAKVNPVMKREDELPVRMKGFFDEVLNKQKGQTVAIVCHGDPLRVLIDMLLYPRKKLLSTARDELYLGKGEAWKLVFNENCQLLEKKLIFDESDFGQLWGRKIY